MQWLLLPPGFMAGMLFWPRVLRWGYLLYFAASGKRDAVSELVAPGGRISLAAVLVNSGLFLSAGILAVTILYALGRLPPGSGHALAGFYAALLFMALYLKRALRRTRQSREAALAARDRRVQWIIGHKAGLYFGLALSWSIPMTIAFALMTPSMSAAALLYLFALSFLGGLLVATLMWFTIIRVAIDDYEYKRRKEKAP